MTHHDYESRCSVCKEHEGYCIHTHPTNRVLARLVHGLLSNDIEYEIYSMLERIPPEQIEELEREMEDG